MKRAGTATEMRRSYLVQRLNKPRGGSFFGAKDNPFSFGGGLMNGGLSPDAMDLLRPIFSFDYMGAAEFEFGAVPEALGRIAKADLATGEVVVPLAEVPKDFRDKGEQEIEGEATIYLLAPRPWIPEVAERVAAWARQPYTSDLKEDVRLSGALRPHYDWQRDTQGWLELSNGFMFFADEAMFGATCDLFGVQR